jgi:hypothetical protein
MEISPEYNSTATRTIFSETYWGAHTKRKVFR